VITERDLQEAIAECIGQRNPNASTCIKLAAFYTIRREMFGDNNSDHVEVFPSYSLSGPAERIETTVEYTSDTEFSQAINGLNSHKAWSIMDELMTTLQVINPRLYNGVMREVEEG